MSKYEELRAKFEDADDYLENCGCDSCEHTRKDIRAFERTAAGLIERARDEIRKSLILCSYQGEYGNCSDCSLAGGQCESKKLLAEMEAL